MKIIKYKEFILEQNDTIETYSNTLLMTLKKKIENMFDFQSDDDSDSDEI